MNESFLDDVGEYMCKAVNEKGTATSKAYLFVKGKYLRDMFTLFHLAKCIKRLLQINNYFFFVKFFIVL